MSGKSSPSVKRIMADKKELDRHRSSRYYAEPLENDMFEWHFTIRGPTGSDFEGGLYHGRILLPPEYPFKPPNIVFLNKNGRFEVGTKICLSISAHHEETWQPAWGIRTMLEAIISFLPSEGSGAIGALDWSKEERQKCARESHSFECHMCGLICNIISETAEDVNDQPDEDIVATIAQLNMGSSKQQGIDISNEKLSEDTSTKNESVSSITTINENSDEIITENSSGNDSNNSIDITSKVVDENDSIPSEGLRHRTNTTTSTPAVQPTTNPTVILEQNRNINNRVDMFDELLSFVMYFIGLIIIVLICKIGMKLFSTK